MPDFFKTISGFGNKTILIFITKHSKIELAELGISKECCKTELNLKCI